MKKKYIQKQIKELLIEKRLYTPALDNDIKELAQVGYEYHINLQYDLDEVIAELVEELTLLLDERLINNQIH